MESGLRPGGFRFARDRAAAGTVHPLTATQGMFRQQHSNPNLSAALLPDFLKSMPLRLLMSGYGILQRYPERLVC